MTDEIYDEELLDDNAPEESHETWDSFWAEVKAKQGKPRTEVIRGVAVTVPHSLPLKYDRLIEQVSDSEDAKPALAMLFGADVLDAWVEAGMEAEEFQVVLLWGTLNGKGKKSSFREAYEQYLELQASQGKAASSATRNGRSAATGARSRRTSGASTATRRKK
ncbi:hypothetical protein [Acrocarpospora sp. B8E8]|uniref:hypothetical protein n=1 Tax=Acrocarpospora sp. B8E8 TaxID=3153572 RepID=UPI00325F15F1